MSKTEIPEQIKNDKMFQFLNKVNNGINESVNKYQSGTETAGELAKKLMDHGKRLSSYVAELTKTQAKKFTAMTEYVNAVNPVLKKDQGAEITPDKVKSLETNVLKNIQSSKQVSVQKSAPKEMSIER